MVLEHVRKNKHLWNPATFQYIERCILKGHWKVDCSPFGDLGLDHAANLTKLLRYVSRDCLATHRIIAIDDENVTIQYKDRSEQLITESIPGVQYIERLPPCQK